MNKPVNYRHEWKHEISPADVIALRSRLRFVMRPDSHGFGGKYFIRSLYFDTLTDLALRQKLDGVDRREKFRIRYYDRDLSVIHLEKKCRQNGLGWKETASLSVEEVRDILQDGIGRQAVRQDSLLWELYSKMRTQGLRPKIIVDYTREAYLFGPGNVRVTLVYNIRTSLSCTGFLDPNCVTIPAGDAPVILEVKWDAFLPDIIRDAVQLEGRHTSAFSKYAACRIYG